MTDRLFKWYPVLFLLALAALTLWLDQKVQPPQPARDGSARHDPDFYIDDFVAQRMNPDGTRRYALKGRKLVHYPDDSSTQVQTPSFTHFEAGAAPVLVTANRAVVSRNGENVYFVGDVHIDRAAFADQQTLALRTELLHVIPDRDLAKTDKAVFMTHGTSTVRSEGMEFDNRARTVKLLSKVKVNYASPVRLPTTRRK